MSKASLLLSLSALFVALPPEIGAGDKPLSEKEKIEALIKHVENLKDAKFIRNDKEYDAESAAKFLRAKWNAQSDIKTAREFVEKVASVSSTSQKPYWIRLKGGKDQKSGEYLLQQLKIIEKKNTGAVEP